MLNPHPQHTVYFTVDDFEKMIDAGVFVGKTSRIELLEGEFYKMSPAGPLHDVLIELLTLWSVQQAGRHFRIRPQMGVRLQQTESMPEPDIYWLKPGKRGLRPTAADVVLAIEVSVSSLRHDREYKGRLYALDGLCEYWVVDAQGQAVEVYTEPIGERFGSVRTYRRGEVLSPLCLPEARLELEWLFGEAERLDGGDPEN